MRDLEKEKTEGDNIKCGVQSECLITKLLDSKF